MVCVGHAINFGGLGSTSAPALGVLLFFILSGFVIAHTLKTKTDSGPYSLGQYAVERTARIYCAYLPAMLLIGLAHLFHNLCFTRPYHLAHTTSNIHQVSAA